MPKPTVKILLASCVAWLASSIVLAQGIDGPAPNLERNTKLRDINAEWQRQREELSAEKTLKWREAQEEWRLKLQAINVEDISAAEKTKKRVAISEEKDAKLDAYMKSYDERFALINETREQNRAVVIAAQGEMLVDLAIASDEAEGSDVTPPATTSSQPVSGTTTPGGPTQAGTPPVDLSRALPPTESLGDEILRNNISADEMRQREQLFAAVQDQRRRADESGTRGNPDGYLGQNDPSHVVYDCDDTNRSVNPNATEICNYIDDDCDGSADIDPATDRPLYQMRFLDRDGDLHGDPGTETGVCPQTTRDTESGGYMVIHGNDCDDSDPERWNTCDEQ